MFDKDAFEERAAIQQYEAGLSRLDAETQAAKAQGLNRWEAIGEINKRLIQRARDRSPQVAGGQHADNMPAMQPSKKKEG